MSIYSENEIHSSVIIHGDVKMGKNNKILPFTILEGPLEIGDDNIIGPHVVIGAHGGDTRNPRYDSSECFVKIGSRNIIREFTAIQKPCYKDITRIGNDVYIMQNVHVPHDVIIEDQAVLTAMVAIGGLTKILRGANLGMGCTLNQYCVVGQYSIVATGAPAMKNVRPFSRYIPGKPTSVNYYAIKKFSFESFTAEIESYVLSGQRPLSPLILDVVNAFDLAVQQSKRATYGE